MWPTCGEVAPNPGRDVALGDLQVVEVHLDLEVRLADLLANRVRLGLRVEEVTRHVARVDRLDQQVEAVAAELARGVGEVLDEHGAMTRAVRARGQDARHRVHARRTEGQRVLGRTRDAFAELGLATGQRQSCPRSPAAQSPGGRLNRTLASRFSLSQPATSAGAYVVREQELDRGEARLRRGGEPLRERRAR